MITVNWGISRQPSLESVPALLPAAAGSDSGIITRIWDPVKLDVKYDFRAHKLFIANLLDCFKDSFI